MYKLYIIILTLSLISCSEKDSKHGGSTNKDRASNPQIDTSFIQKKCIKHTFAQGHDENLYGLECIEGKQLVIKTSKEGALVSTSAVSNNDKGLRIEDGLKFKNKFYTSSSYDLLTNQGDNQIYDFLSKFLPLDEKFQGALDTQYHIIFKTDGNYLTLYKASKELKNIPHTETSSLKILRNNKTLVDYDPDSYKKQRGDYYIVPFIGYPIQYCKAEAKRASGVDYNEYITNCKDSVSQKAQYIKVNPNSKAIYNYQEELKTDLFPSNYFDGQWYYSTGPIESSNTGELAPVNTSLIQIEKEADNFNLIDISGNVRDINRISLDKIGVKWRSFEKNQKGNNQFLTYGEKEKTNEDQIKRPYVQIDFPSMEGDLIELIITQDYLSYIQKITLPNHPIVPEIMRGKPIKFKTSFLRASSVDTEGFIPRKWFLDDHNNIFGILSSSPQKERQRADNSENERFNHFRMIRFNSSLNTEEEKTKKTKTIKWHLSKNSTKDPDYIKIAERAIQIYNQAFHYISQNSKTEIKITVELEEERKDLGDLRYNIINLTQKLSNIDLLGIAPSYVNPNTGQIVATTANIFIHNIEAIFDVRIRNYIRYEVFQKDKRTEEENEIHVVTPYIRELIQKKCPKIKDFIREKKKASLKQSTPLNDKELITECGKELTMQALLMVILHELGHSFGFAHNKKASSDNENYYKNEDEIKDIFDVAGPFDKIAKSSSFMDYLSFDYPTMNYLGKYDLATLRYLYFNEIELENGEIVTLAIDSPLKEQKGLLKERKNYLHCSDHLEKTQIMCDSFDYGENPKEVAEELILRSKRVLNSIRYRYDLAENLFYDLAKNKFKRSPHIVFRNALTSISNFYRGWVEFRDDYLTRSNQPPNINNFTLEDETSIDRYIDIVKQGVEETSDDPYTLYYPLRDMFPEFIMELLMLNEMKCHVEDTEGGKHSWALESIKDYIKYSVDVNRFYVEDCYSAQITEFFKKNSLTLERQTGYENFMSYHLVDNPQNRIDVAPVSDIQKEFFDFLTSYRNNPYIESEKKYAVSWWDEPDKLKNLTETAYSKILKLEDNTTPSENSRNNYLFKLAELGLKRSLDTDEKREFLMEHENNVKFIKYQLETGPHSFDAIIRVPLAQGIQIEKMGVPFLEAVYKEYLKEKKDPTIAGFQDYVLEQEDVLKDNQILIIPFKKNNFIAEVIKKYKKNKEQIKELNRIDEQQSVIKIFKKKALIQHNEILVKILRL